MNTQSTTIQPPLRGDLLRRKALNWALGAMLSLLLAVPVFWFLKPLWHAILSLGSASFLLATIALGLVMAVGPVCAVICSLVSLFMRVEACFAARHARHPAIDRLVIAGGLLVSFAPALAALYPPVKALITGYIAFRGVGQQYPLASDPYGFWQAIASWLMGAAALATLAALYWRSRFRNRSKQPVA